MKPVKIKQRDVTDCGAACLASIAAFYKLKMSVARIRQFAATDKKGTSVAGIIEAAKRLGFDVKGVKGDFQSLFEIPKPAIAHLILATGLHHYVVIYGVNKRHIIVMDPANGMVKKYTHDEFQTLWSKVLVLMLPNQNFIVGDKTISVSTRFLSLIRPHRAQVFQCLFGALTYTVLGLSTSIFVQKIVDHVLIDGNRNLLNLMGVIMSIIVIVQIFIGATKSVLTMRTGQLIDSQLILGYYKHLLKLPQDFFDRMRVGEIISRINDAVKIRAFMNDVSINMIVNFLVLILSFLLMFTYYWKLAVVILTVVPCYMVIYLVANRLNKKVERQLMEDAAELESQLIESLNSVRTIKSHGLESFTNLKTEIKFVSLLKTIYKSGLNGIFSGNATEFFSQVFVIILMWVGTGFVMEGQITPGELLSFYALIAFFTGPANSIIGMNKVIQNARIAADRLFEIMDLEQEQNEDKVPLTREMIGNIVLSNVSFRYGTRANVLIDFSLLVEKGKVTAIVGESGSGKSTIAAILQNLYPIQSGSISIGDLNLKYIETASLRHYISVVPQSIHLFAGNVIENIAVGDFHPDLKKIISICAELDILQFIEQLPKGFHSYLGENGTTLSGGQRQKIAIARALYRDPEILILDEATASLDSAAEQHVQRIIELLRAKNKTIILIAHRLSTVVSADKIVVVEAGKVVEEGSHNELVEAKNRYFNLWRQQFPMLMTIPHSLLQRE